ncbi:MAG: hypothetical protein KDI63_13835 [Gammaproteobacteria bacterium]|nr:hypothetical protein [Gammaproteobacteria bacterium]
MGNHRISPQFLDGPNGRLFSILYSPGQEPKQAMPLVVHVPAFAEEMNKSRRMITLQSQRLLRLGYRVLLFDLFGTGDSEGDFRNATWSKWCDDLEFIYHWAERQQPSWISLWALRSGALLTMELLKTPRPGIRHLLFWQPIPSGEQQRVQINRQSLLATGSGIPAHADSDSIHEVGGYEISGELLCQLSDARLVREPGDILIDWLEITTLAEDSLPRESNDALEGIQRLGGTVTRQCFQGKPFWHTPEVAVLPNVLKATEDCYARLMGSNI